MKRGTVHLVGAGPGATGLITVRGRECLSCADVVIYDNLCNPALLKEAPRDAEIIFAGKHSGTRTLTQSRIEQIMVRRAKAGRTVVRLKGGDPFVFGRGGEEAATLKGHGIKFEVVPGVTSAIAVPAFAGIPVTHRDHASGVAIVTAYEDPDKPESALDYGVLAGFPGTLVVLMSVKRLGTMADKLVAAGKSSRTPMALVRWGTRGMQQTLVGTLGDIAEKAAKADFRPPAVAVVGDVVRCRKQLHWFEQRPLFGRRIVVTRTREQSSDLAARLRDMGAEVIELPTIEIQRVQSTAVRNAARRAGEWEWVVFASPWSVDFFLDAVMREHGDVRALSKAKFAVIGPATATRLNARGLKVDLMPWIYTGAGLAEKIKRQIAKGKGQKVLLPRSEIGGDEIESALRTMGAHPQPVVVYRNVMPKLTWEISALERIGADLVTFTSSSTALHFAALLKNRKLISASTRAMLKRCRFVSIGPSTSASMRRVGLRVHAEAKPHTMDGLIRAVQRVK